MIRVCLVGVGLINGSLGQALRLVNHQHVRKYFVTGWSRSKSTLPLAKKKKALDLFSHNLTDLIPISDVVVLGTPVHVMPRLIKDMVPYFKKGTVLTDVGSVKESLERSIKKELLSRPDVTFVGGHPLAGSEKSGVSFSTSGLFKGAVCVLTKKNALVGQLWADVGARVVYLSPRKHDEILALTSHWPHVMAFLLFSMVKSKARLWPMIRKLTAGSFNDMTRIAQSEPSMWRGILHDNRSSLLKIKKQFSAKVDWLLSLPPEALQRELTLISKQKQIWPK